MRWTIALVTLALAGCGGTEETVIEPEEVEIAPERILYQDIEANDLFGASCAFAPAGGGSGAIAIAMMDAGFIKIGGEIVRLAAINEEQQLDPPELKFAGEDYAFSLNLDPETERPREGNGREFDAQLSVRARDGSTIYDSAGLVQCGSAPG